MNSADVMEDLSVGVVSKRGCVNIDVFVAEVVLLSRAERESTKCVVDGDFKGREKIVGEGSAKGCFKMEGPAEPRR